jgi:hypothetical protein
MQHAGHDVKQDQSAVVRVEHALAPDAVDMLLALAGRRRQLDAAAADEADDE